MRPKLVSSFEFSLLSFLLIVGKLVCNGAELTNRIPSDEVRYNEANPQMIWGDATNFLGAEIHGRPLQAALRSGISVSNGIITLSGHPLEVVSPARFCFDHCSGPLFWPATNEGHGYAIHLDITNYVNGYLPSLNERFDMVMTNADGAPVPKTPEGRRFGRSLSLEPNAMWPVNSVAHQGFDLLPRGVLPVPFSEFNQGIPGENDLDPTKYFKVVKRGLYKLTITQRVYIFGTNNYVKAITLPPVTVPVRVQNDVN
jgi:hypothetical protein